MLERIVQVSRAAAGLRAEDVYGIIRTAHASNTLAGLTGGLIFLDGWFAQVLEGAPGPALDACLARIARDPRHQAIERRSRERALCRLFPGQALALRTRACIDPGAPRGLRLAPGLPGRRLPRRRAGRVRGPGLPPGAVAAARRAQGGLLSPPKIAFPAARRAR